MRDEFHILVEMQHYVYILVATFNQLEEAYDLIQQCQCQQIVACGVHYFGGVVPTVIPALVVGRAVAEKLFEFYPDKASYKIMLSNLCASQEIWWDAEEVRSEMSKEDMHKNTGKLGWRNEEMMVWFASLRNVQNIKYI
ncbi:hypothetical protein VPH35_059733 [Triticum aestivum]